MTLLQDALAALEPFAEIADRVTEGEDDKNDLYVSGMAQRINLGMLRRARAVLTRAKLQERTPELLALDEKYRAIRLARAGEGETVKNETRETLTKLRAALSSIVLAQVSPTLTSRRVPGRLGIYLTEADWQSFTNAVVAADFHLAGLPAPPPKAGAEGERE